MEKLKKENLFKVAVYMRIGNPNEIEKDDFVTSQKNIANHILNEKLKNIIIDYYVDYGYSGIDKNRPEYCRLKKEIFNNKYKVVFASDYSVLNRDFIESIIFLNLLRDNNVSLITQYGTEKEAEFINAMRKEILKIRYSKRRRLKC